MAGPVRDSSDAYQQMEAMLLRQMMQASGAFKASAVAGGHLRADMFIETLADAVSKGGGIGLARLLEDSMPAEEPSEEPVSLQPAAKRPSLRASGDVTSGFGPRPDPIEGTTKYHTGIDIRAPQGSPIRVAADGVVKNAGPRGGYGNAIEIDHGRGLTTLYAHASELLVTTGQNVKEGQPIGLAGMTGRATGPHLHFEVRVNDHPVDPAKALNSYRERADISSAGKPPGRGAR